MCGTFDILGTFVYYTDSLSTVQDFSRIIDDWTLCRGSYAAKRDLDFISLGFDLE
jgi:hypothetical protein